jgi:hypothetical protein
MQHSIGSILTYISTQVNHEFIVSKPCCPPVYLKEKVVYNLDVLPSEIVEYITDMPKPPQTAIWVCQKGAIDYFLDKTIDTAKYTIIEKAKTIPKLVLYPEEERFARYVLRKTSHLAGHIKHFIRYVQELCSYKTDEIKFKGYLHVEDYTEAGFYAFSKAVYYEDLSYLFKEMLHDKTLWIPKYQYIHESIEQQLKKWNNWHFDMYRYLELESKMKEIIFACIQELPDGYASILDKRYRDTVIWKRRLLKLSMSLLDHIKCKKKFNKIFSYINKKISFFSKSKRLKEFEYYMDKYNKKTNHFDFEHPTASRVVFHDGVRKNEGYIPEMIVEKINPLWLIEQRFLNMLSPYPYAKKYKDAIQNLDAIEHTLVLNLHKIRPLSSDIKEIKKIEHDLMDIEMMRCKLSNSYKKELKSILDKTNKTTWERIVASAARKATRYTLEGKLFDCSPDFLKTLNEAYEALQKM